MGEWILLLLQPVALVAWGLLGLVALAWRRSARGVRNASAGVALLYFAAATPLGANLAVGALEGAVPEARACLEPRPGSAIVVLAGGMSGVPAGGGDVGSLQIASVRRVLAGVRLARSAPGATLILSGGSGEEVREADLMASLAAALGVPPERLLVERESRTTAENAAEVGRILAARPGSPAVHLVTSAMHMPRAVAAFRRRGVEVCPVPVDRRRVRPAAHEALLPQISALEKSTAAWHEAVGYLLYSATGRL